MTGTYRRFAQNLAVAGLCLALSVGGAQAQNSTDLSQVIVPADALGDGWMLSSQDPEDASSAIAGYGARYTQAALTADLVLYEYADRAAALASFNASDQADALADQLASAEDALLHAARQ